MAPGPSRPQLVSSVSSSSSDRSSSVPRSSRSGGSSRKRSVRFTDSQLVDLAAHTQTAINWSDILTNHSSDAVDPAAPQWKWLDDVGAFRLYCKQEPLAYQVLVSASLSCSVAEIVHLLHAPNSERYLQNMEALHGDEFRDGAFVHRVDLPSLEDDTRSADRQDLLDLSVKSAIFGGNNHKWSFVEAAYRRANGEGFEKLTTTVHPNDAEGGLVPQSESQSHDNFIHSITTGFLVVPEPSAPRERAASGSSSHLPPPNKRPWKETRVYFFGELAAPVSPTPTKPSAFDKGLKQRLLTMARSCERLTELVRRRRLGLQPLPERKSSSLFGSSSASSTRCVCCNKTLVKLLLGVKHCRICTQPVCSDCSQKHERETRVRGSQRMLLEDVRVCERCMDRVDRSECSELDDRSLLAPRVVLPHASSRVAVAKPVAQPVSAPASVLTELLNKELLQANSSARKASVMSVIKQMMDQETNQPKPDRVSSSSGSSSRTNASRSSGASGNGAILLTPAVEIVGSDYVQNGLEKLQLR